MALVIGRDPDGGGLVLVYTTTFGAAARDPHIVRPSNINDWWPIAPAPANGDKDPLPGNEGDPASWIYVGEPIIYAEAQVRRLMAYY